MTTLADTAAGDVVAVREILFDRTRLLCEMLGIRIGDVLETAARDVYMLSVQSPTLGCVKIDPFYACFIEVQPAPVA